MAKTKLLIGGVAYEVDYLTLYVGNLSCEVDDLTLVREFSSYSAVTRAKVITTPTGDSMGFGFVHFESEAGVDEAIEKMNGREVAGRKIKLSRIKTAIRSADEFALWQQQEVNKINQAGNLTNMQLEQEKILTWFREESARLNESEKDGEQFLKKIAELQNLYQQKLQKLYDQN